MKQSAYCLLPLVVCIIISRAKGQISFGGPGGHHILWILEFQDKSRDSTGLKMRIFKIKCQNNKLSFGTKKITIRVFLRGKSLHFLKVGFISEDIIVLIRFSNFDAKITVCKL